MSLVNKHMPCHRFSLSSASPACPRFTSACSSAFSVASLTRPHPASPSPPPPACRAASDATSSTTTPAATVQVVFQDAGITATGTPGQPIADLASSAGVELHYGCFTGSCGVCEMELRKFDTNGTEGAAVTVRTCIAVVPSGFARIELAEMDDGIWGMDGFDT